MKIKKSNKKQKLDSDNILTIDASKIRSCLFLVEIIATKNRQ